MVGLGRFELPTHGLGNRCSIRLSYRPTGRNRFAMQSKPNIRGKGVSTGAGGKTPW